MGKTIRNFQKNAKKIKRQCKKMKRLKRQIIEQREV